MSGPVQFTLQRKWMSSFSPASNCQKWFKVYPNNHLEHKNPRLKKGAHISTKRSISVALSRDYFEELWGKLHIGANVYLAWKTLLPQNSHDCGLPLQFPDGQLLKAAAWAKPWRSISTAFHWGGVVAVFSWTVPEEIFKIIPLDWRSLRLETTNPYN